MFDMQYPKPESYTISLPTPINTFTFHPELRNKFFNSYCQFVQNLTAHANNLFYQKNTMSSHIFKVICNRKCLVRM